MGKKMKDNIKKELIKVLIQRGYDSDPVKAWKEAQQKVGSLATC